MSLNDKRNNSNSLDQKKLSDSSLSSDSCSESESDVASKQNSTKINKKQNLENENIINNENDNNISQENMDDEKDYEILYDYKDKVDYSFKAIIIGDPYVGKSSLINKAIKQKFEPNYNPTLGFDYFLFHIRIKNKILKLQIWDTCGQEIYQSLITNFYRNSSVAFMVYSIDNKESFDHIDNWLKEIKYTNNPDTKIFLIGNKTDLDNERKVSFEEGKIYANNYEFSAFYETSAKTGDKVDEIMIKAAKLLYDDYIEYQKIKINSKKDESVINSINKSNRDFELNSESSRKPVRKKKCC